MQQDNTLYATRPHFVCIKYIKLGRKYVQIHFKTDTDTSQLPESTEIPTESATKKPTDMPTDMPTDIPTESATKKPTDMPTQKPLGFSQKG